MMCGVECSAIVVMVMMFVVMRIMRTETELLYMDVASPYGSTDVETASLLDALALEDGADSIATQSRPICTC